MIMNGQSGETTFNIFGLTRDEGHRTQFSFVPFLDIKSRKDATYALNTFNLSLKPKIECQIFCIVKSNSMKIKVQVESNLIRKISNVVFHSNSGTQLNFEDFKTISADPHEYLSNEILNFFSILRNEVKCDFCFSTVSGSKAKIKSGAICYVVEDICEENSLLKNCLKMGNYHDLTMKLDNGKEFQVHKMVLAFRSQVFRKMIDSDMMENKTGIIHVRDIKTEVMQEILNYIYDLPCDLSKSPHNIFQAAHLYEMNELTELCRNYMAKNVSYENFFEILELIDIEAYELSEVNDALANFLENNESEIVKNVKFIESLTNNMRSQSIHHLFRFHIRYGLNLREKVITFILENLDKVLQNPEFRNLLYNNPAWSLEILDLINAKINPGLLPN